MDDNSDTLRQSRDSLCEITLFDERIEVQVFPGTLEEEQVKQIIYRVQHIAGVDQYPILVIPDKNTKISFGAVKVLASDAAMNYANATAYIVSSFHHKVMAETLFSMYTTSKPVRVFKEQAEALNWLNTFK